jgi:hypothetical protein
MDSNKNTTINNIVVEITELLLENRREPVQQNLQLVNESRLPFSLLHVTEGTNTSRCLTRHSSQSTLASNSSNYFSSAAILTALLPTS